MGERWRNVEGFDRYEVSSLGRVRNQDGRVLYQETVADGHRRVDLWRDGRRQRFYVHRLVLLAFVGPPPGGYEVAHHNGDPADNRLANLRWTTRQGNVLDKRKHGTHGRLTESDVREIRRLFDAGQSKAELAAQFNCTTPNIHHIVTGHTWRWVR